MVISNLISLADILKLMLQMNVDQSAENAASRKKDLIEVSSSRTVLVSLLTKASSQRLLRPFK